MHARCLAGRLRGEAEPQTWAGVDNIPDDELWQARCRQRAELIQAVRARSTNERLLRGQRALDRRLLRMQRTVRLSRASVR